MLKALVIDDENSIRTTFNDILSKEGFDVYTAANWEETENIINNHEDGFDVIFLDVYIPKIDGLEILKRIKKKYPNALVIIMTGEPSSQIAASAFKLEAANYIEKPITKSTLIQVALRTAERKKLMDDISRMEHEKSHYQKKLDDLILKECAEPEIDQDKFKEVAKALVEMRKTRSYELNKVRSSLKETVDSFKDEKEFTDE